MYNAGGYANPRVDQLIAEMEQGTSPAESTSAVREAQEIIGRDMPTVPLVFPDDLRVAGKRVRNLVVDARGVGRYELSGVAG